MYVSTANRMTENLIMSKHKTIRPHVRKAITIDINEVSKSENIFLYPRWWLSTTGIVLLQLHLEAPLDNSNSDQLKKV